MANGTDFLLKVQTQLQGNATSELARVEQQLKSGVAAYAQYERASQAAAKGLADVGNRVTELRAKMAQQMAAGDEKGFWKSAEALNKLAEKQTLLKTKASEAAAGMDRQKTKLTGLSGKFDELKQAQTAQVEGGVEVGKGLKKLGGPLGKVGDFVDDASEGWAKLVNELGTAGAVGAVAAVGIAVVAVAVLAVGAAALAGAASFAKWVLGVANARRESALTTEALSKTSASFARTTDAIDETQRATGVATERLQAITGDLRAAGVSATDIPYALRAIATQEAALGGDTSGTAALVEKLKSGQVEARALATDMDQRLGGVVQRRMMSLDGLIAQLTRNLQDIFGGMNIEPLLEAGQRLVSLLDTSNGSGRTLKAIFDSLSPSLEGVGPIAVQIERFVIGIEIAALRLAIGVKNIRKQFGSIDLGPLNGIVDAADAGQVAFYALLVGVGLLTVAFGALAVIVAVVAVPAFALMALSIAAIGVLLLPVIVVVGVLALALYGIYSAAEALSGLDWASIGKSIVDGLLGPILDPGATVAAFAQFGTNAIKTLKDVWEIASPSKLTQRLGKYLPQGLAIGIEDGTPQVESALSGMTSAPVQAARENAGLSLSVQMGDVNGVKDADDLVERIADKVLELLEGAGRQGAPA